MHHLRWEIMCLDVMHGVCGSTKVELPWVLGLLLRLFYPTFVPNVF